jgi:hypothetical protein
MRYSSGMNFTIETQERLDAEMKYGYVVLAENPVPIFRFVAETPDAHKWDSSRANQFMSAVEPFRFDKGDPEEAETPVLVKSLNGGLKWMIRAKGKDGLANITEIFTRLGVLLTADGPQPE